MTIFLDQRVPASGPKNAKIMAVGMAPAKWEVASKRPFSGPSGKIYDESLAIYKIARSSVYVTNLCDFFIDDNDLYTVPLSIMEAQRERVFREIEAVSPNILIILGGDTLDFLTASSITTKVIAKGKDAGKIQLITHGSRKGITKWRGSLFTITTPRGRIQKCIAMMHPSNFLHGQWKWLPIFKYVDVKRAVTQSSSPDLKLTPREAIIGPSFRDARDHLREAQTKEWVSIDYEGRQHITCLGSGWSVSSAMCIPLSRVGNACYWTLAEEIEIWKLWNALLINPKVKKIAQNAAFEWIKSWIYGIYPNPLGIDTMLAHHCLYPDFGGITDEWSGRKRDLDNPGHGLAFLTSQYTDQPFYKDDGRRWTPELGEDKFWQYNCTDVMVTYEIAQKELSELQSAGLLDSYNDQYNRKFEPAIRMEWQGIAFDVAKRDREHEKALGRIHELSGEFESLTGQRAVTKAPGKKPDPAILNLGSPKQFGAWMKKRGYKPRMKYNKKEKKSKETWDKDTMTLLAIKNPDDKALRVIMELNKTQDFIDKELMVKLDENGRLHSHFKLGGTNGTRWSSTESILGSGTNLQNPSRTGPARSLYLPS